MLGRVLAEKLKPELHLQLLYKKLGIVVCVCNPSTGELETRVSLGFAG